MDMAEHDSQWVGRGTVQVKEKSGRKYGGRKGWNGAT